ncbi:MAG: 6-phosphofructokinase [Lachnospiraceae bacterium]|nr:6-phosphofructokinase [Lachnospiraceae bacterium]
MAEKKITTIGVLTSGGDAPGMNAAVRAVVRIGINKGYKVVGIYRGYHGLFKEEFRELSAFDVRDTVQHGGTILYTARSKRMMQADGPSDAAKILKKHGIDVLVAIGGDGTFRGALEIARCGINVIGIPATIDLDMACTDYTIGFDSAIDTAVDAIDKIRDSGTAHERISIIEVMGRKCGSIALWCGIASGAEEILIPETYDYNDKALIDRIKEREALGKKQHIIINAEGVGDSEALARRIENATGIEARATILGYMQRGGSPSTLDRVKASLMGEQAIECIIAGRMNRAIIEKNGKIRDMDLEEAVNAKKEPSRDLLGVAKNLIRR